MGSEEPFSGWDDVDDEENPESFQSYLDTVTGLESMQALKRRSHRLLAPKPGAELLDVGCGNGDDVLTLADAVGSNGRVVGVDESGEMIEEARSRAPATAPVTFREADAERLPFDDGCFDGTRADRVLQHLERPKRAFDELRRVTRSGGRVAVTDADWGTLVVDPPTTDLEALTARILETRWSCARNGRVGRRLRRWAVDASLTDLTVDTETMVLTAFPTADRVLGLTGRVERMREDGALSAADGERWLDALGRDDEEGTFFSSLTLYTVAGTSPR
jgi:SAM-dependent methyltransferase